ncbi:unnamed protein product [Clonostachys chloroleuca]|uniref:Uncharacterized protein n=1 Tax=Clonostachys chloroleuca TaxID=1926264 RepID=A0AA35LV94_9HYPO|nr:unnamed protein product [Clonostachys chloroleuca]
MAQYSTQYWPEHAKLAKDIGEGKPLIWDLMKSAAYKINWSLYDNGSIFNGAWSGGRFPPTLYYASLVGLSWLVEGLLEDGADINAKGHDGTALNVALDRGHDEIVHLLLQAGADADARNVYGETPLYVAAERGSHRIVQWLVEHTTDINATSSFRKPLWIAVKEGHGEIVRYLLEHGADANAADGRYKGTYLQTAVLHGHGNIVQHLLKHGADVNAISTGQDSDGTALEGALACGHAEIAQQLIDHGANINAGSKQHGSALYQTATQGFVDIVEKLLDLGADPNVARDQGTALHEAVESGHEGMIQQLIDHGADINAHMYANRGEIVRVLVHNGANVNGTELSYCFALHRAAMDGQGTILQQLLDQAPT